MLAFSNDYYGMIFRATQSVELFCAYVKSIINNDGVLENEVLEGEGNTISYDVWLTARANLVSNFTYHHKNQKHFNQFTMSLLFCVILFYRCWGQKPCYSTLKILHKSFNFPQMWYTVYINQRWWKCMAFRTNSYQQLSLKCYNKVVTEVANKI